MNKRMANNTPKGSLITLQDRLKNHIIHSNPTSKEELVCFLSKMAHTLSTPKLRIPAKDNDEFLQSSPSSFRLLHDAQNILPAFKSKPIVKSAKASHCSLNKVKGFWTNRTFSSRYIFGTEAKKESQNLFMNSTTRSIQGSSPLINKKVVESCDDKKYLVRSERKLVTCPNTPKVLRKSAKNVAPSFTLPSCESPSTTFHTARQSKGGETTPKISLIHDKLQGSTKNLSRVASTKHCKVEYLGLRHHKRLPVDRFFISQLYPPMDAAWDKNIKNAEIGILKAVLK